MMMARSEGLARLARIPGRIRRDVRLVRLLENWRAALVTEWKRVPLGEVRLRNGAVLEGPNTINLAFLFHETWVREVYTPPGYEIRAGDVVIDIGANIGVFAIYAATRAPGVKVYAFEPFPGNISWLRRNAESSHVANVEVHQRAVGASLGVRFLNVDASNWGLHSLWDRGNEEQRVLSVDCISLDDIMKMDGVKQCDLLKLDCEGGEYEVLYGCAPETLRRVRRIVGEYHEGAHFGGTGKELCRFLESRSFRIDRLRSSDANCGILCASNTAG